MQNKIVGKRNCPKCGTEIIYSSREGLWWGKKKNSPCRRCRSDKSGFLQRYATKGSNTGADNGFFGHHHSLQTIDNLAQQKYGCKLTKERKKRLSEVFSGNGNNMYGRSLYGVWEEKYGREEANRRLSRFVAKQRQNNTGSGNPMFGRPSPGGSGNGWSGWYRDTYFRSIRELSYIVKVLENQHTWISAERKDMAIKYVNFLGRERNYFADFLVDDCVLVEVKPKRLHNSQAVMVKADAARKFCTQMGWTYKLTDVIPLNTGEIYQMFLSGLIRFLPRYEKRAVALFKEMVK